MPRRREVPKREILPDPKFGSVELAKFMNVVMLDGKKAVAERIVYGALEQVATKTGKEPIEVFSTAINNIADRRSEEPPRWRCQLPRRLKCAPCAAWPWLCVGSVKPPRSVARSRWICVWLAN